MSETISIIVPVYNIEDYIGKCVDSILAQTYRDIEVILVDDGSTDESGAICDRYAADNPTVTAYHKTNGGLSDARNYGIDRAHGTLIGFVDGDDRIHPQMYEVLHRVMSDTEADIAACRISRDDEEGFMAPVRESDLTVTTFTATEALINFRRTLVSAWNKLYRAELFEDLRYPVGRLHEDEYLLHRLYRKCRKVAVVQARLYFYVSREGSIVNVFNDRRIKDALYALEDRVSFCEDQGWNEVLTPVRERYCDYCIEGYYASREPGYASSEYSDETFLKLERDMVSRGGRHGVHLKYRIFAKDPVMYGRYMRFTGLFKRPLSDLK